MSRAGDLRAAIRALGDPDARILAVGTKGWGAAAKEVDSPREAESSSGAFDLVVWAPQGEPSEGVRLLRASVRSAGHLVLLVEPAGMARKLWTALSRDAVRGAISIEQSCESMLAGGLLLPRVLGSQRGAFAVCGRKPSRSDPLDALFEQPRG